MASLHLSTIGSIEQADRSAGSAKDRKSLFTFTLLTPGVYLLATANDKRSVCSIHLFHETSLADAADRTTKDGDRTAQQNRTADPLSTRLSHQLSRLLRQRFRTPHLIALHPSEEGMATTMEFVVDRRPFSSFASTSEKQVGHATEHMRSNSSLHLPHLRKASRTPPAPDEEEKRVRTSPQILPTSQQHLSSSSSSSSNVGKDNVSSRSRARLSSSARQKLVLDSSEVWHTSHHHHAADMHENGSNNPAPLLNNNDDLDDKGKEGSDALDDVHVYLFIGTSNGTVRICDALRGTTLLAAQFQNYQAYPARSGSPNDTDAASISAHLSTRASSCASSAHNRRSTSANKHDDGITLCNSSTRHDDNVNADDGSSNISGGAVRHVMDSFARIRARSANVATSVANPLFDRLSTRHGRQAWLRIKAIPLGDRNAPDKPHIELPGAELSATAAASANRDGSARTSNTEAAASSRPPSPPVAFPSLSPKSQPPSVVHHAHTLLHSPRATPQSPSLVPVPPLPALLLAQHERQQQDGLRVARSSLPTSLSTARQAPTHSSSPMHRAASLARDLHAWPSETITHAASSTQTRKHSARTEADGNSSTDNHAEDEKEEHRECVRVAGNEAPCASDRLPDEAILRFAVLYPASHDIATRALVSQSSSYSSSASAASLGLCQDDAVRGVYVVHANGVVVALDSRVMDALACVVQQHRRKDAKDGKPYSSGTHDWGYFAQEWSPTGGLSSYPLMGPAAGSVAPLIEHVFTLEDATPYSAAERHTFYTVPGATYADTLRRTSQNTSDNANSSDNNAGTRDAATRRRLHDAVALFFIDPISPNVTPQTSALLPAPALLVCGHNPAFALYTLDSKRATFSAARAVRAVTTLVSDMAKSLFRSALRGTIGRSNKNDDRNKSTHNKHGNDGSNNNSSIASCAHDGSSCVDIASDGATSLLSVTAPPLQNRPQRPRIALAEGDSTFTSVCVDAQQKWVALVCAGAGRVYVVHAHTGVICYVLKGCRAAQVQWACILVASHPELNKSWGSDSNSNNTHDDNKDDEDGYDTCLHREVQVLCVLLPLRHTLEVHCPKRRRRIAACSVPFASTLLPVSHCHAAFSYYSNRHPCSSSSTLAGMSFASPLLYLLQSNHTLHAVRLRWSCGVASLSQQVANMLRRAHRHRGDTVAPELLRACRQPNEFLQLAQYLPIPRGCCGGDCRTVTGAKPTDATAHDCMCGGCAVCATQRRLYRRQLGVIAEAVQRRFTYTVQELHRVYRPFADRTSACNHSCSLWSASSRSRRSVLRLHANSIDNDSNNLVHCCAGCACSNHHPVHADTDSLAGHDAQATMHSAAAHSPSPDGRACPCHSQANTMLGTRLPEAVSAAQCAHYVHLRRVLVDGYSRLLRQTSSGVIMPTTLPPDNASMDTPKGKLNRAATARTPFSTQRQASLPLLSTWLSDVSLASTSLLATAARAELQGKVKELWTAAVSAAGECLLLMTEELTVLQQDWLPVFLSLSSCSEHSNNHNDSCDDRDADGNDKSKEGCGTHGTGEADRPHVVPLSIFVRWFYCGDKAPTFVRSWVDDTAVLPGSMEQRCIRCSLHRCQRSAHAFALGRHPSSAHDAAMHEGNAANRDECAVDTGMCPSGLVATAGAGFDAFAQLIFVGRSLSVFPAQRRTLAQLGLRSQDMTLLLLTWLSGMFGACSSRFMHGTSVAAFVSAWQNTSLDELAWAVDRLYIPTSVQTAHDRGLTTAASSATDNANATGLLRDDGMHPDSKSHSDATDASLTRNDDVMGACTVCGRCANCATLHSLTGVIACCVFVCYMTTAYAVPAPPMRSHMDVARRPVVAATAQPPACPTAALSLSLRQLLSVWSMLRSAASSCKGHRATNDTRANDGQSGFSSCSAARSCPVMPRSASLDDDETCCDTCYADTAPNDTHSRFCARPTSTASSLETAMPCATDKMASRRGMKAHHDSAMWLRRCAVNACPPITMTSAHTWLWSRGFVQLHCLLPRTRSRRGCDTLEVCLLRQRRSLCCHQATVAQPPSLPQHNPSCECTQRSATRCEAADRHTSSALLLNDESAVPSWVTRISAHLPRTTVRAAIVLPLLRLYHILCACHAHRLCCCCGSTRLHEPSSLTTSHQLLRWFMTRSAQEMDTGVLSVARALPIPRVADRATETVSHDTLLTLTDVSSLSLSSLSLSWLLFVRCAVLVTVSRVMAHMARYLCDHAEASERRVGDTNGEQEGGQCHHLRPERQDENGDASFRRRGAFWLNETLPRGDFLAPLLFCPDAHAPSPTAPASDLASADHTVTIRFVAQLHRFSELALRLAAHVVGDGSEVQLVSVVQHVELVLADDDAVAMPVVPDALRRGVRVGLLHALARQTPADVLYRARRAHRCAGLLLRLLLSSRAQRESHATATHTPVRLHYVPWPALFDTDAGPVDVFTVLQEPDTESCATWTRHTTEGSRVPSGDEAVGEMHAAPRESAAWLTDTARAVSHARRKSEGGTPTAVNAVPSSTSAAMTREQPLLWRCHRREANGTGDTDAQQERGARMRRYVEAVTRLLRAFLADSVDESIALRVDYAAPSPRATNTNAPSAAATACMSSSSPPTDDGQSANFDDGTRMAAVSGALPGVKVAEPHTGMPGGATPRAVNFVGTPAPALRSNRVVGARTELMQLVTVLELHEAIPDLASVLIFDYLATHLCHDTDSSSSSSSTKESDEDGCRSDGGNADTAKSEACLTGCDLRRISSEVRDTSLLAQVAAADVRELLRVWVRVLARRRERAARRCLQPRRELDTVPPSLSFSHASASSLASSMRCGVDETTHKMHTLLQLFSGEFKKWLQPTDDSATISVVPSEQPCGEDADREVDANSVPVADATVVCQDGDDASRRATVTEVSTAVASNVLTECACGSHGCVDDLESARHMRAALCELVNSAAWATTRETAEMDREMERRLRSDAGKRGVGAVLETLCRIALDEESALSPMTRFRVREVLLVCEHIHQYL